MFQQVTASQLVALQAQAAIFKQQQEDDKSQSVTN
jgi:hypothetical protein